ncbi:type IV pilus assembly protein FimV [Roseateles koreensis]|uniref:FimV N-terminal domain-containing protein n=1 Tax=Roseateles koreensis TaxID=2987526 RepID=A0ABT5KRN1_9BURK|nr:hypothetical protein [Roseateles koreensis]MDC8784432.1 hypothetical protein [Roseateles koreensis]
MPPQPLRALASALSALVWLSTLGVGTANALGVDRPSAQSALGQPLSLTFPVRLNAGESLSAECVQVEIYAGETRLLPTQLRVQLLGDSESTVRGLRVSSTQPLDEPIVNVRLSLVCPSRLTRQYSVLIDPPDRAGNAELVTDDAPSPRKLSPAMQSALSNQAPVPVATPPAQDPRSTVSGEASSASPTPAPTPTPTVASAKARPRHSQRTTELAKTDKSGLSAKSGAHEKAKLRLEPLEPAAPALMAAATASAAALAASQPSPAASDGANAAALDRLQKVEEDLARMRLDKLEAEARLQVLRAQLEAAQREGSQGTWMAGLGLAVLALSAAVFHLWRSRRDERAMRDKVWWQASADASVASAGSAAAVQSVSSRSPAVSTGLPTKAATAPAASPADSSVGSPVDPSAASVAARPLTATGDDSTLVLPYRMEFDTLPIPAPSVAARPSQIEDSSSADSTVEPVSVQLLADADADAEVAAAAPSPNTLQRTDAGLPSGRNQPLSVELLIDLEQQVDFFMVLGQMESAADLLHEQIRNGSGNALPYLKLLEIYQQQGNAQGFSDIASTFSVRFGAKAPVWGEDMNKGRRLEDYPDAMQLLQVQWADANASMVTLQQLLASGDVGAGGFDLPAYRELLMLYSVARDLSEHEVRSEDVDLFLPLGGQDSRSGSAAAALMATMVWQAQPNPNPKLAAHGVDILLDEPLPPKH